MATISTIFTGSRGKQMLVVRFTAAERFAHWTHTLAFTVLLVTGMFIYAPFLHSFATGGAGEASRLTHRAAAVLFMAAPLVYLVFSPRDFFYSLKESFSWGTDDWGWLKNAWAYYSRGIIGTMPPQVWRVLRQNGLPWFPAAAAGLTCSSSERSAVVSGRFGRPTASTGCHRPAWLPASSRRSSTYAGRSRRAYFLILVSVADVSDNRMVR